MLWIACGWTSLLIVNLRCRQQFHLRVQEPVRAPSSSLHIPAILSRILPWSISSLYRETPTNPFWILHVIVSSLSSGQSVFWFLRFGEYIIRRVWKTRMVNPFNTMNYLFKYIFFMLQDVFITQNLYLYVPKAMSSWNLNFLWICMFGKAWSDTFQRSLQEGFWIHFMYEGQGSVFREASCLLACRGRPLELANGIVVRLWALTNYVHVRPR